jgi:hypothetical protein
MTRLPENVRTVTNSDGGVILDLKRGKIFRLNPTGATVLELLARGYEDAQITAEISVRCETPSDVVGTDVQAFLALLASNELLLRGNAD